MKKKVQFPTSTLILSVGTMVFTATLVITLLLTGCVYVEQRPTRSNVSATGGTVIENNDSSQKRIVSFEVIGKGLIPETAINSGQARLMGERAAINDGYRQLVEKIRGVYIDAYSQTTNGIIDYDVIRTKTQSWLRGVEVLEIKEAGNGILNAKLQLRIYFTETDMIWWPSGIGEGVVPAPIRRSYLARLFSGDVAQCNSYPWCGNFYYYGQR